jgi:nicotinamidase-related amidase
MPGEVPADTAVVVIDAQCAFVDPAGSLIRTFGAEEAQPGIVALHRLREFLAARRPLAPTIFVRSEYHPGQFTGGDLDHSMAYVCVPGRNIDCEWADGLEVRPHDRVVTKRHADASETALYRGAIERALRDGARRIALAGFQFTTCVGASAISTAALVRDRGIPVVVIEPLTGSRTSSHVPDASGLSRMDSTRRHLQSAGVDVVGAIDESAWAI